MLFLLEKILAELKTQTILLKKLSEGAEMRDQQAEHAKRVLQRAAGAFKGTPFEKLISDAVAGGKLDG